MKPSFIRCCHRLFCTTISVVAAVSPLLGQDLDAVATRRLHKWEQMRHVATGNADSGRLADAIASAALACTFADDSLGRNSEAAGVSLELHASLLGRAGYLETATIAYRMLLERIASRAGANHPWYGIILERYANVLLRQGDMDGAAIMYRQAMSIYAQARNRPLDEYRSVMHALIDHEYARGEYAEVLHLSRSLLQAIEDSTGRSSLVYLNELARHAILETYHGSLEEGARDLSVLTAILDTIDVPCQRSLTALFGTILDDAPLYIDSVRRESYLRRSLFCCDTTDLLSSMHQRMLCALVTLLRAQRRDAELRELLTDQLRTVTTAFAGNVLSRTRALSGLTICFNAAGMDDLEERLLDSILVCCRECYSLREQRWSMRRIFLDHDTGMCPMPREHGLCSEALRDWRDLTRWRQPYTESEAWYARRADSVMLTGVGLYFRIIQNESRCASESYRDIEELIGLYDEAGRYDESLAMLVTLKELGNAALGELPSPEDEGARNAVIEESNEKAYARMVRNARNDPSILCRLYDRILAFKGKTLDTRNSILRDDRFHGNPEARDLLDELQSLDRMIRMAQRWSPAERATRHMAVEEWEAIRHLYEDSLRRIFEPYARARETMNVSWTDVITRLNPGEAVVEVCRYRNDDERGRPSETHSYAILVATTADHDRPRLLVLDASLLETRGLELYRRGIGLRFRGMSDTDSLIAAYGLLWAGIDSLLGDARVVHVAPDGVFSQIVLETLMRPDGRFVTDYRTFRYYTCTRELALHGRRFRAPSGTEAVLVGNPNFSSDVCFRTGSGGNPGSPPFESMQLPDYVLASLPRRFDPLNSSAAEIDSIRSMLASKWTVQAVTGDNATERNFLSVRHPGVFHVSTHGYFVSDTRILNGFENRELVQLPLARTDDILERSVLVFAGANTAQQRNASALHERDQLTLTDTDVQQIRPDDDAPLSGERIHTAEPDDPGYDGDSSVVNVQSRPMTPPTTEPGDGIAMPPPPFIPVPPVDDGIVTAGDVAQMDLVGTRLVTLAACETGVGVQVFGDGVYGLQRAFQLAGARNILMSMWSVEDKPSSLLVQSFYRHWLAGEPVHEALQKARRAVRTLYPEPYSWGAFILVEE